MSLLEEATEKYPANPSIVPSTIGGNSRVEMGRFHCLKK